MSSSLCLFWLAIMILVIAPAASEDVGYVFGERTSQILANANISESNESSMVTFTTAGMGTACSSSRTVGWLQDTFDRKVESDNALVRAKAKELAKTAGVCTIDQICSIYDNLTKSWTYFGDPRCKDYFQSASETLSQKNTGDCDDYAVIMAALVESIGGTTRVILANGPLTSHAYAEVYLGNILKDKNVDQIINWIKIKYNVKDVSTHRNLSTGDVWLNMDWGENINKAAYPGCKIFSAKEHIPVYIKKSAIKTLLNPSPIASFTYGSIAKPNAKEPIIFDASLSTEYDNIKEYYWEFGDKTATTTKNASINHIYSKGGTVIVNLTVTDMQGFNSPDSSKVITINNPPIVDFTYSPSQPQEGDVVRFDASKSKDPDGSVSSYKWDFGDKQKAEEDINPTHFYKGTGNFSVNLTVIDNNGAKNSTSHSIKVNKAPVANFTFSPARAGVRLLNPGESITFDASQSKDPDGHIVNYTWNFGDEKRGKGVSVSHDFSQGGNYTVQLTVRDNNNATSKQILQIRVNKKPVPLIRFSPSAPTISEPVTFDASESHDPDGNKIVEWDWKFGDGATGEGISADHAYLKAGTFNVKLSVTDDQGATNSTSANLTVKEILKIKITSPANGQNVSLLTPVNGTISGNLPKDHYLWLAVSPKEVGKWWPQGQDHIQSSGGKWSSEVLIGREAGKGGQDDMGKEFNISVILANSEIDRQFLEYIKKGNATRDWPGINLSKNVEVMASITVIREFDSYSPAKVIVENRSITSFIGSMPAIMSSGQINVFSTYERGYDYLQRCEENDSNSCYPEKYFTNRINISIEINNIGKEPSSETKLVDVLPPNMILSMSDPIVTWKEFDENNNSWILNWQLGPISAGNSTKVFLSAYNKTFSSEPVVNIVYAVAKFGETEITTKKIKSYEVTL